MSKIRHSQRKVVDDDLGLGFPIEELKGSEAPNNKDVLLHIFHFMRSGVKGHTSMKDVRSSVMKSIKASWKGSGVEIGCDKTLRLRIEDLHSLYR